MPMRLVRCNYLGKPLLSDTHLTVLGNDMRTILQAGLDPLIDMPLSTNALIIDL
jgi:hypothetical protein